MPIMLRSFEVHLRLECAVRPCHRHIPPRLPHASQRSRRCAYLTNRLPVPYCTPAPLPFGSAPAAPRAGTSGSPSNTGPKWTAARWGKCPGLLAALGAAFQCGNHPRYSAVGNKTRRSAVQLSIPHHGPVVRPKVLIAFSKFFLQRY